MRNYFYGFIPAEKWGQFIFLPKYIEEVATEIQEALESPSHRNNSIIPVNKYFLGVIRLIDTLKCKIKENEKDKDELEKSIPKEALLKFSIELCKSLNADPMLYGQEVFTAVQCFCSSIELEDYITKKFIDPELMLHSGN